MMKAFFFAYFQRPISTGKVEKKIISIQTIHMYSSEILRGQQRKRRKEEQHI